MKKIIAVVLAVIIGMTASANAFAASVKKTYISDLAAITAKDESDAKTQFEKAGYKLLAGSNVNSSLKTGVYLGYKETDNADEAITDIAGMNMTGKFSYSDYKTIMEQNEERIKETIDNFEPVIAEFQANYDEEKTTAVAAYKAMNVFKDDDSGKLMGDYLLEYDFSEEAKKMMTDTFMQANAQIILTIMQQASFAGDDNEDTMIDRLTKLGPNGVAVKYRGFPSVGEANRAMAAEYGDTAEEIYSDWESVYNYILETEKELVKVDGEGNIKSVDGVLATGKRTEEDYKDIDPEYVLTAYAMDVASDVASNSAVVIDTALYNFLNEIIYGDGTLLEFFKRPKEAVRLEELYPIVDAMSEGQRSQIKISGLKITLESAFSEIKNGTNEAENTLDTVSELAESVEVTSIFEGVDRSVFEEGVAFTSAATEHERTTNESWITKLTGAESEKAAWLNVMIISSAVTGVFIATSIASALVQHFQVAGELKQVNGAQYFLGQLMTDKENITKFRNHTIDTFKTTIGKGRFDHGLSWADAVSEESIKQVEAQARVREMTIDAEIERAQARCDDLWDAVDPDVGRTAGIIKCVSFVLLAIALAVDAYVIYEYITTPEVQEEAIPHHIMTAEKTEYGEEYVYYTTVKNLKGEAQDTNNHEGDRKIGWLTLYTTKDKAAGNPILAENLRVQTGSTDFKEGTAFVHLFNETAALNLTDEVYTGVKDSAKGTYILFSRDASILAGSAITGGNVAVIGVGGLAVGAILGVLISKLTGKKKKENAAA